MKTIIFDIETKNSFDEVGSKNPEDLDISVVGIYNYKDDTYQTFTQDEFEKLWEIIEDTDVMIGYNSIFFDLPLLNKYAPFDLKQKDHIDILRTIKSSIGRRVSLNSVASGTLGTTKLGDGLDAITWWKEGEIDKIKEYCLKDVEITKKVFEIAREKKLLKYIYFNVEHDIRLDTDTWEDVLEDEEIKETNKLDI